MSKSGIWFIAIFVAPLVVAISVLKLGWMPQSTTNFGAFVTGEVRQPELVLGSEWTIAYKQPAECDVACTSQLESLSNLHTALGKNQQKVSIVVIGSKTKIDSNVVSVFNKEIKELKDNHLYLVDKTGLFVLQYSGNSDPEQNRMIQKGLLKDLKKLLNYSRSS
ncbi:transmembrane cytochrome oxidase associated protein [Pseudoalteromonas sp. T1lg65]|uniref:transmembrane cytochrome oxidase associated protein n=1 Tax=Pseudoalteromonas sp. T1lg65 TaxID=2077101 RepID=UPI003F795090